MNWHLRRLRYPVSFRCPMESVLITSKRGALVARLLKKISKLYARHDNQGKSNVLEK